MEYKLQNANDNDIDILIKYKLETIFEYDKDIEDREKIINYVKTNIPKYLYDYKIILVNDIICGCILLRDYEDGKLLWETSYVNGKRI